MKKLMLLALLMSTGLCATAQWVTIPDDNFANKLNELFPECMDGNQLDSTCAALINVTTLDLSNQFSLESSKIAYLTGLEYFVNLDTLDCSFNILDEIPELPQSLTSLNCNNNNLNSLPELPSLLSYLNCNNNNLNALPELPLLITYLSCYDNNLTSLPELPQSLTELSCFKNNLTSLPELPQSMTILNCRDNSLTTLPELPPLLTYLICYDNNLIALPELPTLLTKLICNDNNLTVLPELPALLTDLHCHGNNLTTLPELPPLLTILTCFDNNLTILPELPSVLEHLNCKNNSLYSLPELPATLTLLYCYNNNLTALPDLPQSLPGLWCMNNNLTSLPELPQTLQTLRCENNQITCLPTLPISLTNSNINYFKISNNPFTCLPNYVPAMSGNNEEWLSYPLCDLGDLEGNPYGCTSFTGIGGSVFNDGNANCEEEESESSVINASIKLLDEEGIQLVTTYTFGGAVNTLYNLVADTGNYTVQLVTENMPFQTTCVDPGDAQDVELNTEEPSALNVDFGVECLPGFDIGVQSVVTTGWLFPGQVHILKIAAGEIPSWYGLQCAQNVSGTVTVYVDGPVSYVGPAENALTPNVSGDLQFTYDIADFSSVNFHQDFALFLETDTNAMGGELVCIDIILDPLDDDLNPSNNTYNHCHTVVNSYDPNIKQVWPQDVEPGYDDYFTYTVYFQNTGTAPAFNIRVADTLDTNLDLNTFEVTAYSHPCLTYVSENVATFRFNNIMLPDSTTDFDGSIGYVQYRIKPLAALPVGTIIENTAHIFFDFNDAIVTNTTQNEFVITTSYNDLQQQLATVFPNPGTGQFNVLFRGVESGLTTHLEVYNLNGQRVLQRQVNENRVVLDLTDYPSGMYLLHVRNEQGSEAVRVVKH